jgi:hypothetical protein
MRSTWLLLLCMAGCGDDGATPVDAPGGDGPADSAPDAPGFNCATASSGTHKVFLALDGVTLTRAAVSDAPMNKTVLITGSAQMATIAPWRMGDANRGAQIQEVVCAVRQSLARFDVDVVTSRPASGAYEMIVIGGKATDFGIAVPANTAVAMVATNDCMNNNQLDVGWVAETPAPSMPAVTLPPIDTANLAVAALGIGDGLAASKSVTNCMCPAGSNEPQNCSGTNACELTNASPIPSGGNYCNAPGATEDQIAKLTARYGLRP